MYTWGVEETRNYVDKKPTKYLEVVMERRPIAGAAPGPVRIKTSYRAKGIRNLNSTLGANPHGHGANRRRQRYKLNRGRTGYRYKQDLTAIGTDN